jgi:hypothetical protein
LLDGWKFSKLGAQYSLASLKRIHIHLGKSQLFPTAKRVNGIFGKLKKKYYTIMRSEAYLDDVTYLFFSKYNTIDIYTCYALYV